MLWSQDYVSFPGRTASISAFDLWWMPRTNQKSQPHGWTTLQKMQHDQTIDRVPILWEGDRSTNWDTQLLLVLSTTCSETVSTRCPVAEKYGVCSSQIRIGILPINSCRIISKWWTTIVLKLTVRTLFRSDFSDFGPEFWSRDYWKWHGCLIDFAEVQHRNSIHLFCNLSFSLRSHSQLWSLDWSLFQHWGRKIWMSHQ